MSNPRLLNCFIILSGLMAAAIASGPSAPAQGAAAGFVPHRAVYGISLEKSRGSGSISQAKGKLEFEWADICTGWTVNQRTLVQLVSMQGGVIDFGWTLSARESKDGSDYRFFIRRLNAGGVAENQSGEAHLRGPGLGGGAVYTEPTAHDVTLPKGTLFPTAHTLLLLQSAEQAELPLWRVVFDGSGDRGLFGINAVLTQSLSEGSASRLESPLLREQKSWRMHLAYFGMDESDSVPEHEQFFRIYANGIVDEMLLDYGDFTLRADLQSLDALPPAQC